MPIYLYFLAAWMALYSILALTNINVVWSPYVLGALAAGVAILIIVPAVRGRGKSA